MGIRVYEGRYVVTYTRRGIVMTYSTMNLQEAQDKLREMTAETIVELTHKRLYFQPDKILELHFPINVK
jgi:hypothetical protein